LGSTAYTDAIEGDADAVTRPRRVSKRYLANVAAWSELPRAQVTMKSGGRARSRAANASTIPAFAASWRWTASAASPASANILVDSLECEVIAGFIAAHAAARSSPGSPVPG